MRKLPNITVGKILEDLKEEGYHVPRATFYRLEKRDEYNLSPSRRNRGRTREYTEERAEEVKKELREKYFLPSKLVE